MHGARLGANPVIESDNNRARDDETSSSSDALRADRRQYYIVERVRYLETTRIRTPCRYAFTHRKKYQPKISRFLPREYVGKLPTTKKAIVHLHNVVNVRIL